MTLTQEKTAALIPLPPGHLACNACGVATPGKPPSSTRADGRPAWVPETSRALCDKCVIIRAEANALVSNRPRLAARYGSIINQRVECLLHVWRVLAVDPAPFGAEPDIEGALTAYTRVLNLVWWATPDRTEARWARSGSTLTGLCTTESYAFLSAENRQALREARRDELARRTASYMPDAEVACPSGHCMLCGTTRPVKVSADKMMRAGGYEVVQRRVWLRLVTNAQALGNPRGYPRATPVEGHLCQDCQQAVGTGSSMGPAVRERAVLAYVTKKMGPAAASCLEEMLDWKYGFPTLPAAPYEHPSGLPGPWAHLEGLFEVLKKPVVGAETGS